MALEGNTQTVGPREDDALSAVAARNVLGRLKEAVQLTEQGLSENAGRLRELLEEATAQVDGWSAAHSAVTPSEPPQHAAQVACSLLTRSSAEPVAEFLLIPFGEVEVERPIAGGSFVFTRRHADSARRWFEQMGRKLAIDYEHQSFQRHNTRVDGLRPAAGWVGRLEVRGDGLWACDVTWTDRAKELLRSGEYRYFSPVIYWTDEDYSDVAGLGPVALTNDPALRGVQALAASRARDAVMDPEEVGDLRELDDGDNPARGTPADSLLRRELEAAHEEIGQLRKELTAQEADAFVERGMRLGKILDSTSMDWRADYLRDREQAEARLQRAPVLLPPGRVMKLDARGDVVSGRRVEGELKRNEWARRRWGIEAEDLAAYERALAAGRIVRLGAAQST
jgi:hypothetical protein